jgi:hypothetical protein
MINLIFTCFHYDCYDPQAYYCNPSPIPADFDNQYQYQYHHYPQAPPPSLMGVGNIPSGADLDSDQVDGNQNYFGFDNTVSESPHDSQLDVDSTTNMNLNPSWNYNMY